MIITIGKKELYFRKYDKSYEPEGYSLMIKDLRNHEIIESRDITNEQYATLVKEIRIYM